MSVTDSANRIDTAFVRSMPACKNSDEADDFRRILLKCTADGEPFQLLLRIIRINMTTSLTEIDIFSNFEVTDIAPILNFDMWKPTSNIISFHDDGRYTLASMEIGMRDSRVFDTDQNFVRFNFRDLQFGMRVSRRQDYSQLIFH